MISEREIIAIKYCLSSESVPPEAVAGHSDNHLTQNLLQSCKSEGEALRLKQDGNDQFRNKKFLTAIHKYTMAILQAPWPPDLQRRITEKYLMSLQQHSPAKYEVAKRLHSTRSKGAITSQDTPGRQPVPLLATCYGNRSAALYELRQIEECLIDIEHAIHHGYVITSQEDKLMRRREKCLTQQRKAKNHQVSNRADDPSDMLLFNAFESGHVTVKSHHTCGRYIEAVHNLQPGDVVLSEEPYAAVLDSQFVCSHCSFCFKKSLTLIPCYHCSSEGYCCSECRVEAWKRHHWMECPIAKLWKKADWMMQLCLRIILRADTEEVVSAMCDHNNQTAIFSTAGYSSLHSLVAHKDKFTDEAQKLLLEKMSDVLTECFGDTILVYLQKSLTQTAASRSPIPRDSNTDNTSCQVPKLTELKKLFHHHLLQLRCNSHFVSVVMLESAQESSEVAAASSGHSAVETTSEKKLGSAIYPTASLMNHSCAPNAIFRFVCNRVVVSITETAKAGQEVNNSYGPQIGRMKRSDRQEILKRKYFFDCNCVACNGSCPDLSNSEVVRDALLCPKCKSGPLQVNTSSADTQQSTIEVVYHCLQCNYSILSEQLTTHIQKRTEARTLFEEATAGNTMSIPLLLKCLKQQSEVLHRHNLELAQTNDALAQAYAMQGDFKSAVPYCQQSCETVGVVYGSNSVEVANETEKLSQLLFHSGCCDGALKTAQEARQLLQIYRGEHHQGCKELEEMIRLLSLPT